MDKIIPGLIALVILMGLIAIVSDAIRNRGWSWGTIAAALLLLAAASGFFYLAARLADRERAWRTKVAANEKQIDELRGSSPESIAGIRAKRNRWRRVQTFVDTWRGRSWRATGFAPPRGGRPGSIALKMSSADAAAAPIAVGAELSIFDDKDLQEGGKFLGIFRVQAVETADDSCQISLVATESPLPPSDVDKAAWSQDYDEVTVYEHLPVDRWMAFQTLSDHAKDDGGSEDADGWLPKSHKTPDDRLQRLEDTMKHPKHHDEVIPEDEWQAEADKLARGQIPPGSLWAVVEFENDVTYSPREKKFVLGEAAAPAEAEATDGTEQKNMKQEGETEKKKEDDDDAGPVGAPGEMQPGQMIDPGGEKKEKEETRVFTKGSTAEFDYQTAAALQNDKQWCRIKSVIYRRPLADPFTALRGGEESQGMYRIKQTLLNEIAAIERNIGRISASGKNVDMQSERVAREKGELEEDLVQWEEDVAAAGRAATAFDARFKAATLELGGLEAEIVDLGRQLRGAVAALTQTIDAAAPPPVRQR
jgi:hypothetical protein